MSPVGNGSENAPHRLLLTPKQAADALAISPRKLWAMTASGENWRCLRYDPPTKARRLRERAARLKTNINTRQTN